MSPQKQFSTAYLESVYTKYTHKKFVHPDPLEFLYNYTDINDREIVALIASSLAYGRVAQILKSIRIVLDKIEITGQTPSQFVKNSSKKELTSIFKDFKHRFSTGNDLSHILAGSKKILNKYSTFENCIASKVAQNDETLFNGIKHFATELTEGTFNSLIPDPSKGSACKRINLMFRWMVRQDNVDPGGWSSLTPSKLIIPLDTHMYKISLEHNLTKRKSADLKTALEITMKFKKFAPDDPVRYDFSLTRPGIGGY